MTLYSFFPLPERTLDRANLHRSVPWFMPLIHSGHRSHVTTGTTEVSADATWALLGIVGIRSESGFVAA